MAYYHIHTIFIHFRPNVLTYGKIAFELAKDHLYIENLKRGGGLHMGVYNILAITPWGKEKK